MIALVTVLTVILISLLVSRVATAILTLTGMSRESARFQARSALTGVGFTTTEAESVVNHPVRRRVVMTLMLVGGAGIVTTIATLMLSFTGADRSQTLTRVLILLGGLAILVMLSRSDKVDRWLSVLIGRALERFTDLDTRDYAALLHLGGDFGVLEIAVQKGDWLADRTLGDADLRSEGVAVLGIERPNGEYVGAPVRETPVRPGDVVIAYGPRRLLCQVDARRVGDEGDREHERAVEEQRAQRERERTAAAAAQ